MGGGKQKGHLQLASEDVHRSRRQWLGVWVQWGGGGWGDPFTPVLGPLFPHSPNPSWWDHIPFFIIKKKKKTFRVFQAKAKHNPYAKTDHITPSQIHIWKMPEFWSQCSLFIPKLKDQGQAFLFFLTKEKTIGEYLIKDMSGNKIKNGEQPLNVNVDRHLKNAAVGPSGDIISPTIIW